MDRTYNIVQIRIVNNRVDFSVETCSGLSITDAEKKIADFAEDAIQHIKDQLVQSITISKRSVTIETKDYGETITNVYTVVNSH